MRLATQSSKPSSRTAEHFRAHVKDWEHLRRVIAKRILVAHGGTSVPGSFIQTLRMMGVATGWTECFPLVLRESALVVERIERAQSLFPWRSGARLR